MVATELDGLLPYSLRSMGIADYLLFK